MKKLVRLLAVVLAVLTVLTVAAPALAASKTPKPSIIPETLWADCEYASGPMFNNMPDDAKLVSIKSSNPSVLQTRTFGDSIWDAILEPLKAGKAKITVKYKVNKKTASISATYTVKKYPKPLSYVKVNGAKIDIKNNKYFYDFFEYGKTKTKVTVKPSSGWKIVDSWGWTAKPDNDNSFKEFTPKSGKSFTIKKGYDGCVFFTLGNKLGETIQYGIRFYRNPLVY